MRLINTLIALLITAILALIGYLYNATHTIEKDLYKNLNKIFIDHVAEVSKHIELFLQRYLRSNPYIQLKNNPQLRSLLQEALALTAVSPHRYVYVLYRDKRGRFRYLLDGSQEDRGEFNQKLDVNTKQWNLVYTTKRAQLFLHKDSSFLYITYLRPLLIRHKVAGVIAIDFTSELPKTIAKILSPAKRIINYLFLLLFILFLILIYQLALYMKTRKKAMIDTLTQTYNRNYLKIFMDHIDPANYAILMLDIDHFKKINDNYGHKVGDFILQETAKIIQKLLRKEDFIFRYGGEEFLIFIKNSNYDDNYLLKIAERLRKTLENTSFEYNNHQIKITASIGLITNPQKYRSLKEAIKQADEFLYQAKRLGRNQTYFSNDYTQQISITNEIQLIKDAIENGRLFIEVQPIYDIVTNTIYSFEALVRIKDEKGNTIYPTAFLEQIAFTTVYTSLTKEVLRQAFAIIKKYQIKLSINLNFSDITDSVIFNTIIEEIENNRQCAQYLLIELLENESFAQFTTLQEKLYQLKNYKIQIAIDDFGSGYSNFEILKQLPIDILKINGTLIKEIPTSKVAYNIVKSITSLANSIDIKVIAEYVENEQILNLLNELHIQYAQGFYLGKPRPLEAYLQDFV